MDCKVMATIMASNLNLLCDASLESVDATMYRHMIYSLMYLMDTRPDTCFVVNTLRHVYLMVASMIRRLTWRVMWIRIRQAVPLIGRALWGCFFSMRSCVISWLAGWIPAWH